MFVTRMKMLGALELYESGYEGAAINMMVGVCHIALKESPRGTQLEKDSTPKKEKGDNSGPARKQAHY